MSNFVYLSNVTYVILNSSKDARKSSTSASNISDNTVAIIVGSTAAVFFVVLLVGSYYCYYKNRMVYAGFANYTYNATRVLPLTVTDIVINPPYASQLTENNNQNVDSPVSTDTTNNNNNNDEEDNRDRRVSNASFTIEEAYSYSSSSSGSSYNSTFNVNGHNESIESFRQLNTEQFTMVTGRKLSTDVEVCDTPPVTAVTIPSNGRGDMFSHITHPLISMRPRIPMYEVTQTPLAHAEPLTSH